MIPLGSDVLRDLERASRLEWLQADGQGGWASSTPLGLNSRRYHSLLVMATAPPGGRVNLLSRVDEQILFADGIVCDLATNQYAGAVHPRGLDWAESFSLDPLPVLAFATPHGRLVKTVARLHETNAVVVLYEWSGPQATRLVLRPMLAYRGVHELQRENQIWNRETASLAGTVVCAPRADWPPLSMRVAGAHWEHAGHWYRDFDYALERDRGLDHREDLWSPGAFHVDVGPGRAVALVAAAGEEPPAREPLALVQAERRRQRQWSSGVGGLEADLRRSADAFVVRGGTSGRSVIAGYPWFADRGRDAMIALPGLCLATGRVGEARAILHEFAARVDGPMGAPSAPGLLRPQFLRGDGAEVCVDDGADAALWFVLAVRRLFEADPARDPRLESAVELVLEGYRRGTAPGIRVRADGLVEAGADGLALTWMDASLDGRPVTARRGCPIEIQALWLNAVLAAAELARGRGDDARAASLGHVAARCRDVAQRAFWSEERGYLADVIDENGIADFSLRPNQLYAIALPHGLLPREKAERVLAAVESALLTPRGLRTLARTDARFRGRCSGGVGDREAASHQGTVWPFLIGAWVDARLRLHGEAGKRVVHDWLAGFAAHLDEAGLGHVSEAFDGDPPHQPGGVPARAWSTAELLRACQRAGRPPRGDTNRAGR